MTDKPAKPDHPRPVSLPPGYVLPNVEEDGQFACGSCGALVMVTRGVVVYGHTCPPAPKEE